MRPWVRWSIYLLVLTLVASGGLWLCVHFLAWPAVSRPSMEGLPSAWEAPLMKAHGAAVMGMLFFVGRLSGTHVLLGWRVKRRVFEGLGMLMLVALLTLSGYTLYYWVPEGWRDALGLAHGFVGLLAACLLFIHRRA